MATKYWVTLSPDEQATLSALTSQGQLSARKMKRAQILMAAHKKHTDDAIATIVGVGLSTVHRTRQKFIEGGIEFALNERPRPGGTKKLDSKAEALLIATACSEPPEGRCQWTMQLLADRMVELQVVDSLSDETVRRTLQKNSLSLG